MLTGSTLIGRDGELARFAHALDLSVAGLPQVIVLEGAPGMGKTALLNHFLEQRRHEWHLTRVTCDRFEAQTNFATAGLLLGDWVDGSPSSIVVGRRLLEWFGEVQADAGVAAVSIDDAQWMDQASADALRFAIRRLRADRVLVILARRPPDGADPWEPLLIDTNMTTPLALSALLTDDALALAVSISSTSLDPEAAERLMRQSGGVPLLVKALAQVAVDGDAPRRSAGSAPVRAVQQILRHLDAAPRQLLQALAVFGQPANVATLSEICGLVRPARAMAELLATPLVRQVGDPPVTDFSHALFRDAIYERVPADRRRELHVGAAGLTGGDAQLRHRVAAADRVDDELAGDLVTAARARAAEQDHAVAARHYLAAAGVSVNGDDRDRLLALAVVQLIDARDVRGALRRRAELESSADTPEKSLALGMLLRESGETGPARQELLKAIDSGGAFDRGEVAEQASLELATLHTLLTEGVLAAAASEVAIRSSDPVTAGRAMVLRAFGMWLAGDGAAARGQLDAIPAAQSPESVVEPLILAASGAIRIFANDHETALRDFDASIRLARLWHPSIFLDQVYVHRSEAHYQLGDWDAAAVDAANAVALAEAGDRPWALPFAHGAGVAVFAGRGEWAAAQLALDKARGAAEVVPSFQGLAMVHQAMVRLAIAQRRWEEALSASEPYLAEPVLSQMIALGAYRIPMLTEAEALLRLRRLDEATASIDRYEAAARINPGALQGYGVAWLRGLAAALSGDAAAARAHYLEEINEPTFRRSSLGYATVVLDLGRLELGVGNRREAIDRLRAARDIFVGLRATPFVDQCEHELATAGLPIRSATPTAATLTPREQDVATVIARGLTNAEAGAELFVTAKTIDYHLGNIYAKLGIAGRRELRNLLAAQG